MGLCSSTQTARLELHYNTEIIYHLDYLVYLLLITFMVLATKLSVEKTSTSYVSRCWCSQVKSSPLLPKQNKGLFFGTPLVQCFFPG